MLAFIPITLLLSISPNLGIQQPRYSKVNFISEVSSVKAGSPFRVAFVIDLERGWHVYWSNPGDSGMPTSVVWKLPSGFTVSELQFPFPKAFNDAGIVSYGFENKAVILATITPPKNLSLNSKVEVEAEVKRLVCKDTCLPENSKHKLNLTVKQNPEWNTNSRSIITSAQSAIPTVKQGWSVKLLLKPAELVLSIKPGNLNLSDVNSAYFFPLNESLIQHSEPQRMTRKSGELELTIKRNTSSSAQTGKIQGVICLYMKNNKVETHLIK